MQISQFVQKLRELGMLFLYLYLDLEYAYFLILTIQYILK